MRIVFMGTPDFAVKSLDALRQSSHEIVGVITAPDKPAGRGQKLHQSAVKQYAVEKNLTVLQPTNLKDEQFIQELKALEADLFIVVAFRMLPEVVWNMPPKGTFNLHASLLPQYRGAAPINWAVINGEKESGVTTFFLKHEIDTGNIIKQVKVPVEDTDTAGDLHDKLMNVGALLVVETADAIEAGSIEPIAQDETQEIKHAPKIFKQDCEIDWSKSTNEIYNFIRGLSPYPAAHTYIIRNEEKLQFKIFQLTCEKETHKKPIGTIEVAPKSIRIATRDGWIIPYFVQIQGKKRMKIQDLMNGFDFNNTSVLTEISSK